MSDLVTRMTGNGKVAVFLGPESGIADWTKGPTNAEALAFTNVSGAVNWDSYGFNVQASPLQDDRTIVDAAGSKSRGPSTFGGDIEFVYPQPGDTTSVYHTAYNILTTPRVKLAIIVRVGAPSSQALAAGDVINVYHVLADAHSLVRATTNKPSYAYKITFNPQDDVLVHAIVPASTAGAVVVTGAASTTVGTPVFLKAVYQGVNVTVGAAYTIADPTKGVVTPHGILIPLAAGTAAISATYPGSAAGSPLSITIS